MTPPLALSTAWNSKRHSDGHAMLAEIAALGFSHAELSHGIRIGLVPGILKAVREGVIRISSVHAFCPLPPGVDRASPNLFEPSTEDAAEAKLWKRYVEQSIDFAVTVDAKAVVLHLGSSRKRWFDPSQSLATTASKVGIAQATNQPRYLKARDAALEKLRKQTPAAWGRVVNNLKLVTDYAESKGVRLGLENREGVNELPLDEWWPHLWERDTLPACCGYWHDSGHAQIKAMLGLLDVKTHLEALASRMIGFHLHDTNRDGHDHRPVGHGLVDFELLSSYWKLEHLFTLELAPGTSLDDVRASREKIESLLRARGLR